MKTLQESKEELFEIYKSKFGMPSSEDDRLRKEFEKIMLLKTDYMPYWFACEVFNLGVELDEKEYF